jgi:ABC-type multidrug transport system fused ATPase/permease subunit
VAATAAQSSAAFLNPALLLVINLGLTGALWVGGGLVIDGKMELGSVFVLLDYLVAVKIPLVPLSVLLPQIASADSSVGRVIDVLDEVPDVQDKPGAPSLAEAAGGKVKGRVASRTSASPTSGRTGSPTQARS